MRTCSLSKGMLLCLVIFLTVIHLSCRNESPEGINGDKPEPNAPAVSDVNIPSEPVSKDVIVKVNGFEITESMVKELIGPQLERLDQQAAKLPPSVAEQYKSQLRNDAVEQLIRRRLLDEQIQKANITITEEEVMNQINQIASAQDMSLEDFKKTMEQYGRSFEEVKQDVRKMLSRNKFMEDQWAGKIEVTEEDAKKYYEENKKRFDMPEKVRASHILIQFQLTDPNADPNEVKAKAKTKAENLLQQLKDGADFAEVAKANSDCPSAPQGGDLGFFPRGETTPQFEKVAFELEIGKISDIVETEYGYHIIKVTDHEDAEVIPFEQAKNDIIKELTEKKQLEFAKKYIDSLKEQADIVYPFRL